MSFYTTSTPLPEGVRALLPNPWGSGISYEIRVDRLCGATPATERTVYTVLFTEESPEDAGGAGVYIPAGWVDFRIDTTPRRGFRRVVIQDRPGGFAHQWMVSATEQGALWADLEELDEGDEWGANDVEEPCRIRVCVHTVNTPAWAIAMAVAYAHEWAGVEGEVVYG